MSDPAPRSVAELQAAMAEAGHSPEGVALADDRDAPRVDGMTLFRHRDDGTWQTSVWERGQESHHQTFASEEEAVRSLAPTKLRPPPQGPAQTPEERKAVVERMQAEAREVLRQFGREPGEERTGGRG